MGLIYKFQQGGNLKLASDNTRVDIKNLPKKELTKLERSEAANLEAKAAQERLQKAKELSDRYKRLEDSRMAQKKGFPTTRQELADQTQATGDKLRVSNKPNIFDDYINPAAMVGEMASTLGSAPLRAKKENSIIPYVTAVGAPLVAGILGAKTKAGHQATEELIVPQSFAKIGKSDISHYLKDFDMQKKMRPSKLQKEIKKEAVKYYNDVTSPESFARAERIDAEHGTDLVQKLNNFKTQLKEENIITDYTDANYLPFNISLRKDPLTGSAGVSKHTLDGAMKNTLTDNQKNRLRFDSGRDRVIEINDNVPLEDIRDIVRHELKHHWTDGGKSLKGFGDELSEMYKPISKINKNNPELADELAKPVFTDKKYSGYEYFTNPTEVDAYIATNMKDDMVKKGILKNYFDDLTTEKVNKYIATGPKNSYQKFLNMADKKNFLKTFNKTLPAVIPSTGILYNKKD